MTAAGSSDDARAGSGAPEDPPALVEPPVARPVRAAPAGGAAGHGADRAAAEPSAATPEGPAAEPSAATPEGSAVDAAASHVELHPTQPSTQPMTAPGAVPPRPLFDVDSWMDAPPGTIPGLADAAALAGAAHDDDLAQAFAADRFHDYDEILPGDELPAPGGVDRAETVAAGVSPFGMPPDDAPLADGLASAPGAVRRVLIVGSILVAGLALVAVYAAGRGMAGVVIGAIASPPPSAASTPAVPAGVPTALAAPGVQPWDRLAGGECLQGYSSPWAESFTVVDCSRVHTAQLLLRAPFPDAPKAAYPGITALEQRMSALCSASGVIDLGKAGAASDLQLGFAFPVTRRQWEDGERDYWCFASRSSGAPISGSITAGAQDAVWAARAAPTASSGPSPSPTPKRKR
ncbi:MAG: hypothetical protein HY996_00225 [Micrococcales bacterium]|nr:hypothetical protein [Micrococcales bacterium]